MTDISIGDRFYFNNYCVQKGYSVPDYLIVTDILPSGDFVKAEYENHAVDTRPRLFSKKNLHFDSNLNPKRDDPSWIFTKAKAQEDERQGWK